MKPISELSGLELDAAVAEEVMGFPVHDGTIPLPSLLITDRGAPYHEYRLIPRYSSSWDAAREVVEKSQRIWTLKVAPIGGCKAEIFEPLGGDVVGLGITLSEAICRAALAWARSKAVSR